MSGYDEKRTIRLKRDEATRTWLLHTSAGWTSTPWAEEADASAVALWVRNQYDRTVAVQFE